MVRSIFAGLITIIFNFVFLASFILFVLLNTLLNVDFYEGSLSESLYEATVDVVTTSVAGSQEDIDIKFSEADFEKVLRETITAEDFENILVPFVENLVEPEFDETGVAVIEVDFSEIVDKLPNFVSTLSSYLFDTIAPCEVGVVPSDENFCIPDGVPEEDFKNQVTQVLNTQILEDIPSKLTVFELREGDLHLFAGYELNKDFLWTVWWATFMVQILLLLVIALIILKPLHRVIRWVAKPLMSGAILTGVLFMALYHAPKLINNMAASDKAGDSFNTEQAQSVMYFLSDFLGLLATKALMYSAAIFVIGLSIYVFGLLLKHHEHE